MPANEDPLNIEQVVIIPPKPRIELNENNLLSGFMSEFGLGIQHKIA